LTEANIDQPSDADYSLLALENQLCFALYAATRAISRTYREKLDAMGLTYPQYLVLLVLWEQDRQSVSQIGARLRLDSGTLTPLLQRLEGMGLVARERAQHDERIVVIHLTAEGEKLRTAALDARKHVGCRLNMSETEILRLRSEIMNLIAELDSGACRVSAA
jgi:DNA-binding MarR family transcriptional regulator